MTAEDRRFLGLTFDLARQGDVKIRAQLVKRKWRRKLRDNAGDGVFLNIEDFGNTFNDLMIRAQTILGKPIVSLGSTVNKWVFATIDQPLSLRT
jgi:hypothetical protein